MILMQAFSNTCSNFHMEKTALDYLSCFDMVLRYTGRLIYAKLIIVFIDYVITKNFVTKNN